MTDVQICNLALARLGDARISSLTDATAQAQYCSLFYAQTLEELQTEFDWQFCRKLASLTADPTAPAFGYSRRFAVPADFLRLIRLNGIDEDENFSKWEIVDGFIHTDLAAPAQIEYIAHVTDAAKFPAVFIEILSAKLAVNLALPLTASKDLFAQMAEIFSSNLQRPAVKALILATAKDRPSATLTEDELCRQAILRVGTAEQFGPSSQAMLLAKSLYPQVRDALLLTGSWTWAMKSTTVAETLPRPEYKWAYRYAIPSDCLRVFRVNDWDSAAADSAWEVAGNFVLTNADSGAPDWVAGRAYEVGNVVSSASAVYICRVANTTKEPGVTAGWTTDWDVWLGTAITLEYIRKTTEVTLFDSLFIDLLTANLAAKLAVPLTGDANKAALLSKEVEVLGKNPAMRRDSTERKGKIKPAWTSSKLVSSRSGGDGIDQAKATGAGPGGGVSYPSLLVTVGSVTNLPAGATPTVSNSGTGNTAVLNFGLPQSGVPTTLENSGLAIDGNSIATTYNSTIGDGVVSVAVGGAPAAPASAWKAKNLVQVLDDILFPTILASVGSAKSLSLAVSGASGTLEIGSIHTRTLTAAFTRGTILDGNGSTNANPLVGAATGYTFTGTGISSTSQAGNELTFTTAIVSGSNNWAVTATHAAGTGDYFDNKGVAGSNLAASRAAGSATDSTSAPTITGVHPYYYLKRSTPISAADMVAAIQAGTATKVIASSTGTLSIPYAPSAEYFAVAYPSTSTTKTRYYVTALDNGAITVVFAPVATQTVTTALWSQSYRIHVSNGALTNSNATIELRNS